MIDIFRRHGMTLATPPPRRQPVQEFLY
jgi:hypothetical protein